VRLSESLKNSEKSSYQQGVLTEKKENMRLYESLRNSGESSDQQGVLIGEKEEEEDHHHCSMMIGGINVSLGAIFVGTLVYEKMVLKTLEEKLSDGYGQRRGK